MITGVMAMVEMSMGFLNQQNNWKPAADPYFQITPSASLLDQSWLKALDQINQMDINGSRINNLALWGLPSGRLSSCTCYLVQRAVGNPMFNASITKADDNLCLLPWSGNPEKAEFPDHLIAQNSLSLQTTSPKFVAKSGDSAGFPSGCTFTRTIPSKPNNIKHRVIVSPNENKKVLEFYSCAFDDNERLCSFEKI